MKKFIYLSLFLLSLTYFSVDAATGEVSESIETAMTDSIESAIRPFISFLAFVFLGNEYEIFGKTLKFTIFGMPLIVAWLIVGCIFFTLKLRFVNIRLFKHAIDVARGKYDDPTAPGKLNPMQSFLTALAATIGLGNIAGVAIAISIGGPGAVIWMMITAFFGMSTKFAEVTLGQKYRRFKNGRLLAGPFYYIKDGLEEKGMIKTGKILAKFAAFCCIIGALGGGLAFQANQSIAIVTSSFDLNTTARFILVLGLTALIGIILIGGITRIGHIASKIVPFMAIIYVTSCIIVLAVNYNNIIDAAILMFNSAFKENALHGGIIGAIIQGVRRAAFSNEAGVGTAPIAHAASKTKEPVREGSIAILGPFIDTIIICFMTGLVITITGVYQNTDFNDGVLITKSAFATVAPWFTYILSMVVVLFAFSTMLTYSYYGQQAWLYLTNNRQKDLCNALFILFVFVGGMISLGLIIDLTDIFFLSMAIPNLIAMYIMSNDIKEDTDNYISRLKKGDFNYLLKK